MAAENDLSTPENRARTTISVPASVYERVERRLERSEFETADEYATFVLEEVLARVEDETDEAASSVDQEEVETRLEALGYLE
ncbi:hypothetical protein [Haloterrigena alkaliphila]|uniref:CopG family transcriptional regulator n=1 Tax=Haloterrigena alkaliphila TaxID=2816475 RepID=A0A8A2VCJ2_9EURY|nr:hypothetical protein [Haloterrigena alkaliphila]QSW97915.1 hypothetical protein J0X25_10840 [Haloterrigena alkaliphila]